MDQHASTTPSASVQLLEDPSTGAALAETFPPHPEVPARASGSEQRRHGDQAEASGAEEDAVAAAPADRTQLVTFLLNEEEFGFDIMSVQEIIRPPKMARLPQTPEYMEGVANLRGSVLPIFDIRARFGMRRAKATDQTRVLVIDIDGSRTGLLVDGVRQVTRVAQNEFEPPPAAVRSSTTDYIDGIVKLEDGARIIIALDARRVCSHDGATATAGLQSAGTNARVALQAGAAHTGKTKGESMRQLVSFKVGREEFAFPIEDVREILRVQAPKEVPGAPKHLLGVLTVRGQILPIVDLRRLLSLDSLAADHIEGCRKAGAGYQNVLDLTSASPTDQAWLHEAVPAGDLLRQWLISFNSSSQAMMETLAKAKRMNEQASKSVAALLKNHTEEAGAALKTEALELARNILSSLRTFAQQVASNISEDQRIIVVDSNGFHLGLVVDHVNEVLGVQEDDIESPPRAAQHGGVNLSGIAKLDGGERLILLLETGNLLDSQKLAALAKEHGTATAQARKPAAAKESEGAVGDEELQIVTFLLGQEEYGIPIAKIQEIDRLSKVTQTPKAPKFVEGVTNLRGEVIPVLSTRTLFALENKTPDDRTRVIIVDLGGAKTGMVVDSVKEVMSISSRNIAPPPASISSGGDGHFISGIGKVDDGKRMIVLLDVGKVLTRGEQSALVSLSRPS